MDYNFISNVESCFIQLPQLLYYSHLPSIIISLFFGFFVFWKSRRSLAGKILLLLSATYSLWAICNLVVWITVDSIIYSFFWSFFETLSVIFYFLVLYFGYVFIEGKDISFSAKVFFSILLLPVILISSTKYYFFGFDATTCDAIMNEKFIYYVYFIKGLFFLIILNLLLFKYIKYRKEEIRKKKIGIVSIGIILLLTSFLITQYFGDLVSAELYTIEFYGLFAIDIFIGFLVYLIVKYKAFDIKLLAAQALAVAIVLLVGSQFFFIKTTTNMILNGVTFALSCVFGWWLIRSVKRESIRKEELQILADQLASGNAKLQKLDNAKSEFISIASHQLRTPPTAIKGYSSLLLEGSYGKLQPEQINVLNNIYKRNEDMIMLIENLLNSSRIEAGTMTFELGKCNIEELIMDIYETLIMKAKDKKLSLELIKPQNPIPEITTDKAKIKEMLSNLVDNAIKYTEKGKVKVSTEMQKGFTALNMIPSNPVPIAEAEKEEQEKDVVRIVVSDTGIGIPQTELPFLFQKFSRGKDISRLNVSGTGLGLFVGKKIMEALGGRVWAESDGEGKGSRFVAEIPIEGKLKQEN